MILQEKFGSYQQIIDETVMFDYAVSTSLN